MHRPIRRCDCPMCEWYGHDEDEPGPNVGDENDEDELPLAERDLNPMDDYINPRSLLLLVSLFALLATIPATAMAGDTWLAIGVASYHADRSAGYNERNFGLGIEHDFTSAHAMSVGAYRNSIDRRSNYALYRWTPLAIGRARIGVLAGVVDGYRRNGGRLAPALAPTITLDTHPVGISLILIPAGTKDVSAAIGLQVKIVLDLGN